ncbi:UDP-N-acetylenolpyruvoylglucosamine reductase [Lacticaseibacillus paracasei]|uniref:FAD-binding protein n=1 Tax=Lacticaseibacillus paracasei TaxID=1597 RepID=UPI000F0B9DC5|nr:FAD-binding protein [Lacticaseibacillus paracasei]RNE43145.1 UDP-N-acetylenolpyruvoylglucosamine reductase [Lacticaseibacillus paracasei]
MSDVKLNVTDKQNVSLSNYTNTKTGGTVAHMYYPKTTEELVELLTTLRSRRISYVVLGEMTNVAIASHPLNFEVINMSDFIGEPIWNADLCTLTVPSGVKMKALSRWARDHSVAGLQWMEGIPGTVGAGAFMNAGFLGGQDFSSFLLEAQVLDESLNVRTVKNRDLQYSFRKSSLQSGGKIVLSVTFLLRPGKKWKIGLKMLQYHRRRAKNQPLEYPSAGTVFIPPVPYHLGAILPRLGLVGAKVGGARVSEKSPSFIIGENMSGEDYRDLVKLIQARVLEEKHIDIEPEVRMLGFDGNRMLSQPQSCSWIPEEGAK